MLAPTTSFDLHYWQPDARLQGLVSGYHLYSVDPPPGQRHQDVFFPNWTNIRFHVAGDHWRVRLAEQGLDVPRAALFGPSSHAGYSESGVGSVIGAGITPLGWYRMTRARAADFADRIVSLEMVLRDSAAKTQTMLKGAAPSEVKPLLDSFFSPLMKQPRAGEERVVAMHRLLMEPLQERVEQLAARLELSHRTLHRLALTAFGFGPKLLLRRARFLRSLLALTRGEGETWSSQIEGSYYDHSHFNRDAQHFLGMSPGEFLRLPKPMNEASARLRTQVLGAPAQALLQPRLTDAG